ncbi:hypothetical protein BJ742DRAFT_661954, partial [Cladochytrium replicatum]
RKRTLLQYVTDKNRRAMTFSKRKNGILKKVYELAALTHGEVLLLIASENHKVYSYTTPRLAGVIEHGYDMIQDCLTS